MPNKTPRHIDKKYFTFFGGIALCIFSVILILNVGYPSRAIALPFVYLFGLSSYLIYIFVYAYGLFLFFREKGFKIRLNNYLWGSLVIFISVMMIATLIVRSNTEALTINNFVKQYNDVFNNVDSNYPNSPKGYWTNVFVNLFGGNKFGGGFIGYFLVGLLSFGGKPAFAWVFAILIFLAGAFIIFYPSIKKIIGAGKGKKEKVSSPNDSIAFQQETPFEPINNVDPVKSASTLEPAYKEPAPVLNRPASFSQRSEVFNEPLNSGYSSNTNFVPARFNKFISKPAAPEQPVSSTQPATSNRITPEQALLEANKQSTINEQMSLNFDEKPSLNEDLVLAKPEFVEPEPVRSAPALETPVAPVAEAAPVRKPIKWIPPSTALLETLEVQGAIDLNKEVAEERMIAINEVFDNFKIGAYCNSYVVGPSVTRYNIEYGNNVSVKSVNNLVQDISIRLGGVNARFESVVEGQRYSGLEVPNAKITPVSFKEVYESLPDVKKHPLAVVFGKSIDGKCVGADFDEFPHILVAGTTGSGKSIYNHSLVCTLIMRNSPEDLKLVLIDPKQVEFSKYEGLPHLLCPIINDANLAKLTLSKLVDEMNRRYGILRENGCSNLKQYNELLEENPLMEKLPFIVVFIDEYADLVDVCKDISQPVVSLAQKARAAGIHMLIATQRPSTNIITGVIKGNLPTRVALAVASYTDSMTILGEGGGEKLLGKGDMLVQSPLVSRVGMVRLQGCFIQNKEILHIVGYLKEHYECIYDPNFCNLEEAAAQAAGDVLASVEFKDSMENSEEAKYQAIKEFVMANEYMSMSRIQRECGVGFNRAGRFFKRLQDEGIVDTETDGNKGCPVLVHDKFYEGSVDTDIPVSSDICD